VFLWRESNKKKSSRFPSVLIMSVTTSCADSSAASSSGSAASNAPEAGMSERAIKISEKRKKLQEGFESDCRRLSANPALSTVIMFKQVLDKYKNSLVSVSDVTGISPDARVIFELMLAKPKKQKKTEEQKRENPSYLAFQAYWVKTEPSLSKEQISARWKAIPTKAERAAFLATHRLAKKEKPKKAAAAGTQKAKAKKAPAALRAEAENSS
jgi:hypothetical protein